MQLKKMCNQRKINGCKLLPMTIVLLTSQLHGIKVGTCLHQEDRRRPKSWENESDDPELR